MSSEIIPNLGDAVPEISLLWNVSFCQNYLKGSVYISCVKHDRVSSRSKHYNVS